MKYVILFIALFSLSVNTHAQDEKRYGQSANEAYAKGNFAWADSLYSKSLSAAPKFDDALFNKGDAQYRQGNFEEAANSFRQVIEGSTDKELQGAAWHNLGNAQLSQQDYEGAVQSFKNALRINPQDDDSRYNLAYARKLLKQQEQGQGQEQGQEQEQEKESGNEDGEGDQQEQEKESGEDGEQQEQENGSDEDGKQQEQENKNGENGEQQEQENKNGENGEGQQQEVKAGQISKEDAARILESLKMNEAAVQQKVREKEGKKGKGGKIEKDW